MIFVQFPGPNIRVPVGATIEISILNELPNESITIHWHGLHQVSKAALSLTLIRYHLISFIFRQITIGWMVPPTLVNVQSQSTAPSSTFSRQNMRDHIGITHIMGFKEWMVSLVASQFTIQVKILVML